MQTSKTSRRNNLTALLALNGVLLSVLAAVTFGSAAEAQNRARGEYCVVAGNVKGIPSAALYIADTRNDELLVVAYDSAARNLAGIGYRNLATDFGAMNRARSR